MRPLGEADAPATRALYSSSLKVIVFPGEMVAAATEVSGFTGVTGTGKGGGDEKSGSE